MQNRSSLLLILGSLAFGTLGYFLFFYDDGTTPQWTAPAVEHRHKGGPPVSPPKAKTPAIQPAPENQPEEPEEEEVPADDDKK